MASAADIDKCLSVGSCIVECLKPLITKTWTLQKQVSLTECANSIRLIEGHLWQCHGNTITIFDKDLQEQRNLTGFDDTVNDVAYSRSDDVIIVTESGLYQYSTNGDKIATLDAGRFFCSVFAYGDRVYASHWDTASIRVYEQRGSWQQRVDDVIKCASSRDVITISVCDNRVIACIANEHKVNVYDMQGRLLYSVGQQGSGSPGLLDCPYLCCHDTDANILIADSYNHQLQLVDSERKWTIVKLDTEVLNPRDALYHDGKLYVVSEASPNMLYMFQ